MFGYSQVSPLAVEMDQSDPPIANCLLSINDTQIEDPSFGSHGHPADIEKSSANFLSILKFQSICFNFYFFNSCKNLRLLTFTF